MAKKIGQILVNGDTVGNILSNYGPVSKLGIQAPQGTTFFLNGSDSSIEIGEFQIYQLDLDNNLGKITSLVFNHLNENSTAIVDIVYDVGEVL